MMDLKVLVGDRVYRIKQLVKETVKVGGREAYTGRRIMTCTSGQRVVLPEGVVPRMPCRTCDTMKPLDEPCDRTERCREMQRRAEELVAAMHRKAPAHVS